MKRVLFLIILVSFSGIAYGLEPLAGHIIKSVTVLKPNAKSNYCSDSEVPRNFSIPGHTNYSYTTKKNKTKFMAKADKCKTNEKGKTFLMEFYCNEQMNKMVREKVKCGSGTRCVDGACVST